MHALIHSFIQVFVYYSMFYHKPNRLYTQYQLYQLIRLDEASQSLDSAVGDARLPPIHLFVVA